jgi:hypothetical protein
MIACTDLRAALVRGLSTLAAAAAADALDPHRRRCVLDCLADAEDCLERALLVAGDSNPRLAPVARALRHAAAGEPGGGAEDACLRALDELHDEVAHLVVPGDDWTARAVRRAVGGAAAAVDRARAVLRPPVAPGQGELALDER